LAVAYLTDKNLPVTSIDCAEDEEVLALPFFKFMVHSKKVKESEYYDSDKKVYLPIDEIEVTLLELPFQNLLQNPSRAIS